MDQAQAKIAVDALASASTSFAPYANDAKYLIDRPDELNQGHYGVCAMTVAVRTMLLHDRQRFVDLLHAVFDPADPGFRGVAVASSRLLDHRLTQIGNKRARRTAEGNTYADYYDLDFILSRALGKLIKVADADVYRRQCGFSERINKLFNVKAEWIDLFTLPGALAGTLNPGPLDDALRRELRYKSVPMLVACGFELDLAASTVTVVTAGSEWEITHVVSPTVTRRLSVRLPAPGSDLRVRIRPTGPLRGDGDLGLDREGLEFLMRSVVGAGTVSSTIRESAVAVGEANSAWAPGQRTYVYAMINGSRRFMEAKAAAVAGAAPGDPAFDFVNPAPPGPDVWGVSRPVCTHVVDVTGPIREVGDNYVMPVWTWARAFEVRIPKKLMGEYVYGFVYGRL
jgi:hypothetical protein